MSETDKIVPQGDEEISLPTLRQDLVILPSSSFWTGAPSWVIHDGLSNKYFRMGRAELDMLSSWETTSPADLTDKLSAKSNRAILPSQVEDFAKFLVKNSLVITGEENGWSRLLEQKNASKQSLWKKAIHSYLFFRIPLCNPQSFLNSTWPYVRFLFTKSAAVCFALLALLSLFMVSKQWDYFQATFASFLTINGMLLYAFSLVFIKAIHELGHAFMATKYKVAVPVIGAALIVMMPILYTDTTGAHRLNSKTKRLHIDLAGIYAELGLAVIATLFWIFLSDGNLRSIAFTTATLSWTISLAVNLNPFMRFDGYYILSDLFGIENLQERGFAFGRWRLREILFSLNAPPPELLPQKMHWPLILHAWGTWIYRFFLFLGIALLVYAFFIKAVGIFLFIVEIIWFIAAPIWRELKFWWSNRSDIMKSRRSSITASLVVGSLLVLLFPFKSTIEIPAVMKTAGTYALFAPQDAKIESVNFKSELRVAKGDVLAIFSSDQLDEEARRTRLETELLNARLSRAASNAEELSLMLVLKEELKAKRATQKQLEAKQAELIMRAPIDGTLLDIDPNITSGIWLNSRQQIGLIAKGEKVEITGYIDEASGGLLESDAEGIFIPDALQLSKSKVQLSTVAKVPSDKLSELILADINGGRIPLNPNSIGEQGEPLVPKGSWYQAKFTVDESHVDHLAGKEQLVRGIVRIKGKRQSFASKIGRQVAGVLLRELAP